MDSHYVAGAEKVRTEPKVVVDRLATLDHMFA